LNRVFIAIVGETTAKKVHSGLKQARTFVTNGPLLGLEIDGKHPGDEITFAEPRTLPYHASLRSIVPIDHFELIFNGRVIASHRLEGARAHKPMLLATLRFLTAVGWYCAPGMIAPTRRHKIFILMAVLARST